MPKQHSGTVNRAVSKNSDAFSKAETHNARQNAFGIEDYGNVIRVNRREKEKPDSAASRGTHRTRQTMGTNMTRVVKPFLRKEEVVVRNSSRGN